MPALIDLVEITKDYGRFRALDRVTLQIHSGITGLLGPNGAGKSTLLDILASRKSTGYISGRILFNGKPLHESGVRTAYVMQDNVHLPMLTVEETLTFASLLRMRETVSLADKEIRVKEIMSMLGLSGHAHTIVGNSRYRGISGGQLKRLSIGVEIIDLPEVIFLDEPTTGAQVH